MHAPYELPITGAHIEKMDDEDDDDNDDEDTLVPYDKDEKAQPVAPSTKVWSPLTIVQRAVLRSQQAQLVRVMKTALANFHEAAMKYHNEALRLHQQVAMRVRLLEQVKALIAEWQQKRVHNTRMHDFLKKLDMAIRALLNEFGISHSFTSRTSNAVLSALSVKKDPWSLVHVVCRDDDKYQSTARRCCDILAHLNSVHAQLPHDPENTSDAIEWTSDDQHRISLLMHYVTRMNKARESSKLYPALSIMGLP